MGSAPSTRFTECRLLASGRINSMAISRDGQRIVSGGEGCESRVWDGTGTVTTVIGDSVKSCAFSRDGARLLTGGWDNCARLWDAASGALERTFEGHGGAVYGCAFADGGDGRLVTGSRDRTARVWDSASGAVLATHGGHGESVTCCALSDARGASGSWDRGVRVWSAATGELHVVLEGHGGGRRARVPARMPGALVLPDLPSWVVGAADDSALDGAPLQDVFVRCGVHG